MTTHLSRRAFVTGLGFAAAAHAWAKDFWNDKKPSDWTESEVQQMLTRSPWAKDASIFDSATHKGVSSAPYAGGIYGLPPYESPDGKSLPTVRGLKGWGATVRWESALPVREAMKAAKSADAEKNYIIALIGEMPAASVPSDDDDAAERQRKLDVLKESTRLERKDDSLELERVKIAPRTPEDKQVTFVTKVGPLEVKCKFTLREMLYHGNLEL